jgi:diguanylate cyclase (GGDEF)-like protein
MAPSVEDIDAHAAYDTADLSHLGARQAGLDRVLWASVALAAFIGLAVPWLVLPLLGADVAESSALRGVWLAVGVAAGACVYAAASYTVLRANIRLSELTTFDGLTGLPNQRQFTQALRTEMVRSVRSGQPVSLVVADLDHLKRVNDHHGHAAGDDLLAAVAGELTTAVRPYDIVCRIGGAEFALVLPQTTKAEAEAAAERVRAVVAAGRRDDLPQVTVSCGVATYPDDADSIVQLTKRAEDAMYAAKAAGRDAVRGWDGPAPRREPEAELSD